MAPLPDTRQARRDAQSVEIALSVLTGIAVFLGLVVPAVIFVNVLGLGHAGGWTPVAQIGLVLAAVAGLGSTVGVLVRAHQSGI